MLVIVDRLEGESAVVEFPDRTTRDVALSELPVGTKAGDCFSYLDGRYIPEPEETEKRKREIEKRMRDMWNEE